MGINTIQLQQQGSMHNNNGGDLSFNSEGNKLIYAEYKGLIEVYNFDRCTGIISNPVTIEREHIANPYPWYSAAVFSPDGRFVYITSTSENSGHGDNYLYQYDLTSANISASRIVIDSFPYLTVICFDGNGT